jgi:DNA-binding transcriptional ArsR family regulator
MPSWISDEDPVLGAAVSAARELSDPIRLTVLQLLAHEGPHGMSQLAEILDISPARLGNHLTKLRNAGLVDASHVGRHVTYRLRDQAIAPLLDALAQYAGGALPLPVSPNQPERLCYDHAAGRLGVALLEHLMDSKALLRSDNETAELELGPQASEVLRRFGIDVSQLDTGRRKVATSCLDRSLRRPHLGGALGHAILAELQAQEMVSSGTDARTLTINPEHRRRLAGLIPPFGPAATGTSAENERV